MSIRPGVFFPGRAAGAGAAGAADDHLLIQQLLPAASDRVRIQAQEIREQGVAAVTQPQGLQAGEQAALLFVEQSIEQDNRGVEFVGRDLEGGGVNGHRNRLGTAASQALLAPNGGIHGGIEKRAIDFGSAQALLLEQMAERFLNLGVQQIGQLLGVAAVGGSQDEGFHGGYQSALAGEPDPLVRPQPAIIKAGQLAERIEAAAMGVAGEVAE